MDPSTRASLYATMVETSVLVWAVVDRALDFTYVSPSVRQLLGYQPDDLLGTSALDLVLPGYHELAMDTLEDLLANPGEGVPVVMGLRHADGSTVHAEVAASVHLDNPDVTGIVVRLRPYDDQHLLEQYFEALASSASVARTLEPLVGSIKAQHLDSEVALAFDWDGERFATAVHTGLPPALDGTRAASSDVAGAPPWAMAVRSGGAAATTTLTDLGPAVREAAEAEGLVACWAYPVPVPPDGGLQACLIVWRRVAGLPVLGHDAALRRSVQLAALGFERRHKDELLVHAARHDTLTGIPNRSHFYSELAALPTDGDREGSDGVQPRFGPAVLFADLDGFKAVNDTHGHGVGDAVLVVVARRLQAAIRPGDVLARVGGDEFAVLCVDLEGRHDALVVADRLIDAVSQPIQIEGMAVTVGLSVGVAFREPGTSTGPGLVDEADRALYRAKEAGKGRWMVAGTA